MTLREFFSLSSFLSPLFFFFLSLSHVFDLLFTSLFWRKRGLCPFVSPSGRQCDLITIFIGRKSNESGGATSITIEVPKETTKHYNLRRNARIQCHPYEVNNMLILTKKFKTLSLEDISISKDFEDMKRSKPMKTWVPSLNP